ncbi:hypothetical protein [Flavobacterium gilvum]|uniref:Uncharacterized protein n=1 Tax=Flavobacterium gilvum TaxID=1492737 RepID=A0AAC9N756_9FLAO|nr:hypothetical protein [Flavobacterium gilvum]AOW10484.1 hypothetical protein EM308_13780 [Flavobacterium gilvum]KFC61136.1 hypothetical protein FEM08_00720 [Flavobacterium gilvum]
MKIDKELEIDFIRAIQKSNSERTYREGGRIHKRCKNIESQFRFTPKVNEKIVLLNEKLKQEEKRVFYQYRLIEKQSNLMVVNKEIDDFNITVVLSYWNEKHYKKYEPSIEGNPFFETVNNFMDMQRGEIEYNQEPHNEHHDKAPFPEINHCYSFHNLYDHCHELTWFDIYNIDEVWMEIKVDYQFFRKIK